MPYYSQHGQDRYLHETFFKTRRDGIFVEFGALDGLLDSNSLFFERSLNWTGILIEPNPAAFALLQRNRPNCQLENVAISNENAILPFLKIAGGLYGWSGLLDDIEPQHHERIDQYIKPDDIETIAVSVRDLAWLAERHQLTQIDFMSIDTEGTEAKIMRAFPWELLHVAVFCIENNFENYNLDDLMAAQGYVKSARLGPDDIFAHRSLIAA